MFTTEKLDNGVELHVNSTSKFRTTTIQVFVERPLDEHYTQFALLANVLKRGTVRYPLTIDLARRWDSLYGAAFKVQVYKLGDRHVFEFRLEVANEKYLLASEPLLLESLHTLHDLLAQPALDGLHLRPDYVSQEKEALTRNIDAVFNDKSSYAVRRCIEEMFAGDPYARSELGSKEEIGAINPLVLTAFHNSLLTDMACRLVLTGDITHSQAREACADTFGRLATVQGLTPLTFENTPLRRERTVREAQAVNQGKLVLGYRTNTSYSETYFPALAMYNGILGAFPHSKLFLNVREKASLAYYCYSSLLPIKGAMVVQAGIAFDKLEQATDIIQEQMSALRKGDISAAEMNKTRLSLIDSLRSDEDHPAKLGRTYIERLVAGANFSNLDLIERIGKVTQEEVVAVAERVWLDTTYFLCGNEAEEGNHHEN